MKRFYITKYVKRTAIIAAASIMTLSLVSCGNQENNNVESVETPRNEFVYVPEYISLGNKENANYYNLKMAGNSLYYTYYNYDEATQTSEKKIMAYSLDTNEEKALDIQIGDNSDISQFTVDKDGNVYAVEYDYGEPTADGMMEGTQLLCKYDAQGNEVYKQDITEIMKSDENNSWVSNIAVDDQGRLYMTSDNLIRLFDTEGKLYGTVSQNNGWIQGIGCGKDGKVYISYYDSTSATGGRVLTEVNFDGKAFGQTYTNFPNSNGSGSISVGVEKDFLVSDDSKVYEYDMATQTYEELFSWLDSDINGTYVNYVGALENGKLLALINDWNTGETEIAYLTKTEASTLPVKEELVIGTLYDNQSMQAAAVEFNKNSDTYRIRIKTYIDRNNWTENSWQDGITALNNDILSKENCPDILDLSSLNVEQLAAKGVFEDLNPYLESSTVFDKEDFIESIINGYTFDGKLVCIPSSFNLATIAARTSQVGEEMGWTLEEMISYAQEHPEASLFDNYTKSTMLNIMMNYNQNAFVDWESGECRFDSEEFKSFLTFINSFPDEYDSSDERSTPAKIQAGEVLLDNVYIYDLQSIQEYEARFNEPVTFIGYPNVDGNSGCYMTGSEMYAIASKSENKDGAWAFIESFLSGAPDNMFSYGLSTNKQYLEDAIAEATKVEYVLDENGEKVLDENGEPIIMGGTSSVGYGDWEYTYHIPTDEEIAQIKELIEVAVPAFVSDNEITNIINEEAEGFFKGQKTVDDVAGIIQSRVQIYVNENR